MSGDVPDSTDTSDAGKNRRQRRRLYAALVVVVVVVVALIIWAVWPKGRSPVFGGPGFAVSGSATVGQVVYVSPAVSSRRAVTITSVTAVLASNSAPAETFLLVCDPNSTEGLVDGLSNCPGAALFHAVALKPGDGGEIAVGVVPLAAGEVHISGFKVDYGSGGKHTVTTGAKITLQASASSQRRPT